jgi:cyanophycin synthetase
VEKTPSLTVTGNPKFIKGFLYGMRFPSLAFVLSLSGQQGEEWLNRLDAALRESFPEITCSNISYRPLVVGMGRQRAVNLLLYWMDRLQQAAHVPVFEQGRIIGANAMDSLVLVAIPVFAPLQGATGQAFSWLTNLFNEACSGSDFHHLLKELPAAVQKLEQAVPSAYVRNYGLLPRLLHTAFLHGIPYSELVGYVYQFGYGRRSRLLDNTFTDQTSQIGARLARSKLLTARVLRIAGIPVPEHRQVSTIEDAEATACDFGFPVVVKPGDRDGGVGVSAGLTTVEEVRNAFGAALRVSACVLVEKHFEGRDYRLTVLRGELIWAIERVPGGITGDGSSTVQQLLDRHNADPKRGDGLHTPLIRVEVDDEALDLLSKAGLDLSAVPAQGEFVRLRRAANVAFGGTPVPVMEQVHPDNRLLAVRAAALLRLDLAGIDLQIQDISRSWREVGGIVCEVNSQPGLEATKEVAAVQSKILRTLVQGSGRIPIAVVIGASPEWKLAAEISEHLDKSGLVTGWSDDEGVTIGEMVVTSAVPVPWSAGRLLAGEQGIDAVVLCINDAGVLQTGLPFERFDLLVLAGSDLVSSAGQSRDNRPVGMQPLLDALLPCCDGKVMVVAGSGAEVRMPPGSAAVLMKEAVSRNEAASVIAEAMIAADVIHREPV